MHTPHLIRFTVLILVVTTTPALPVSASPVPIQSQPGQPEEITALLMPKRRGLATPPALPAVLPPAAEKLTPLTIETRLRRRRGPRDDSIRQTVSRTTDRVHTTSSDGSEWLFERNVRDPRRVFGTRIDHANRVLILYDESDLRNLLGIRGWTQVLSLGLDHELLADLQPTGKARSIDAVRVTRHATDRKDAELREVWWSDAHFLPGGFTSVRGSGSLQLSVARIRPGVDMALLLPPAQRFPKYRAVDIAEWLERAGG